MEGFHPPALNVLRRTSLLAGLLLLVLAGLTLPLEASAQSHKSNGSRLGPSNIDGHRKANSIALSQTEGSGSYAGTGALIGAGIGAVVGVIVGLSSEPGEVDRATRILVTPLLLGALGGVVGFFVGAFAPREEQGAKVQTTWTIRPAWLPEKWDRIGIHLTMSASLP